MRRLFLAAKLFGHLAEVLGQPAILGEVGLSLSVAGVAVVDARTYSAIVMMVILTTLVTPPALKWRFGAA